MRADAVGKAIQAKQTWIYRRDLLRELVVRDMRMRYKHSILGFAWSLLNPLMHLLVFYFIFRVVLTMELDRFSSHVLIGLVVWNWFQDSLIQAAQAITGNRELIRRPGFQVAILPIVTVITNLIHFLFSLPVLMVVLWVEDSHWSVALIMLPVLMLLQYILTLGLSYFVASANVIFRDTQHLLSILLRLFFFLTPVFYDPDLLSPRLGGYYELNPLVGLLGAYRAILMGIEPLDWWSLAWPTLLAILSMILGYFLFMRVNYRFVEEL